MNSLISKAFLAAREENRPALLTYTVAGDNTKKKSLEILKSISNYADICELGFPHNTPIADGGQIQTSAYRAIKNGIKIPICFNVNINGYLRWFIICPSSKPALAKPYLIVIKSLLNNQIICGIKITKNTSKETKYLKSNFLDFLMKIKYTNIKSTATNK